MVKIVINGRATEIADNTGLRDLVVSCKVKPEAVVAVLNDHVIGKDLWTDIVLNEGDRLELVSIVGGG
ncbi:MAG: bifunctional sulfur carrier protein/thiazole synthase protein [Syntrophorhabdus sp. PtaU1.Bin058]|nr:MAG: bifunctional sulfur carrier protein/thiazole synthase protein [Syntrophorhabdus sp. PtaU1.Bin058]